MILGLKKRKEIVEMIRVMLVDDHDVVRTGFKALLGSCEDMEVVAEASDGAEAITRAVEEQPDVILMDISMSNMDGFEATRQLQKKQPAIKILALTVHEDRQFFLEMLKAGARGYVSKRAIASDVINAIRAVAAGHVYIHPFQAGWLVADYLKLLSESSKQTYMNKYPEDIAKLETLSQRELQVLGMVSDGFTSIQIGARLGISSNTVSRHRDRIMNKLDIHTNSELVKFAIRAGVIDL
jgi:two-component system response regulator NreC